MNENLFPSEPVRDPQLTERIDHFQQRIIKELYDQKIDVASYAMQLEAINNVASTLEHELTNLADWAARFDIDGPTGYLLEVKRDVAFDMLNAYGQDSSQLLRELYDTFMPFQDFKAASLTDDDIHGTSQQ